MLPEERVNYYNKFLDYIICSPKKSVGYLKQCFRLIQYYKISVSYSKQCFKLVQYCYLKNGYVIKYNITNFAIVSI